MKKGNYQSIRLICGNHGDDYSKEMFEKENIGTANDSAFYACREYKSIYGDVRGRSCNNRVGVNDYLRILTEISRYMFSGAEENDLVGLDSDRLPTWKKKGLHFKIIGKTEDGVYLVSVLNKTAIAR